MKLLMQVVYEDDKNTLNKIEQSQNNDLDSTRSDNYYSTAHSVHCIHVCPSYPLHVTFHLFDSLKPISSKASFLLMLHSKFSPTYDVFN